MSAVIRNPASQPAGYYRVRYSYNIVARGTYLGSIGLVIVMVVDSMFCMLLYYSSGLIDMYIPTSCGRSSDGL